MTPITTNQVLTLLRDTLLSHITASADMTFAELSAQRSDIALLVKIELALIEQRRMDLQRAQDERNEKLMEELREALKRFDLPVLQLPRGVIEEVSNMVDPIFCRKPVFPDVEDGDVERPCNRPEGHEGDCDPDFFAPKQPAAAAVAKVDL